MSELRSLRASTRNALETERKRADEEIRKLHEKNRREIERLEREQREQVEEYNRQLIELEKRQVQAVHAAETRIEARLKEEERAIREKIEEVRRDANVKLLRQKQEFEKQLRETYAVIDRRIAEVMAKIRELEEDEQKQAKESCETAIEKYNAMVKNEDVIRFESDTVEKILKPILESCMSAYKMRNWAAATGKALLLETECDRTVNEAKRDNETWKTRMKEVSDRYQAVDAELRRMADEETVVAAVEMEHAGSFQSWDDTVYLRILKEMEAIRDALDKIQAGRFADLTNIEMGIIRLDAGHYIEDAIDAITYQITAHLMAIKVLAGLCAVGAPEWEADGDSEVVEKDHCAISVMNDHDETVRAEIYVNNDALKRGQIRLNLQMAIIGTKNDAALLATLSDLCGDLKGILHGYGFGYLSCVDQHTYTNGEGYPGYIMDLVPDTAKKGQVRNSGITAERNESGGTGAASDKKQENGLKGERV